MSASEYAASLSGHYGSDGLAERILEALRAEGKDVEVLTTDDLVAVDQFHTGGRDATRALARLAGLQPGTRVLDVGSGLGGPARTLAAEFGCSVTGVDLTEEYVRVAEVLTARTGLSGYAIFRHGNALELPFPDGRRFDCVWTQHSSMNIPDKERLYAELHRVLRPGGRLAIHEIMAGAVQPVHFPVPWAREPSISFLRPAEEVRTLLRGTGFDEVTWLDRTAESLEWFRQRAAAAQQPGGPPPVGLQLALGGDLGPMMRNVGRNLEEGRIVVVQAVFDRR